eukprot:4706924-Prymnesium_polylepis.1
MPSPTPVVEFEPIPVAIGPMPSYDASAVLANAQYGVRMFWCTDSARDVRARTRLPSTPRWHS